MWKKFCNNKIVKFLASLKLAVCVILAFTLLMVWGTLTESAYSTTYAKWQVYLSWPFIAVEIFLFLNILFAALVRLPYKKRLSGFYMIHAGLLTLLIGAGITAVYGIDGNIRLLPKQPSNAVVINEPTFYGFYNSGNITDVMEFVEPLPKVVKPYSSKNRPFMQILDYDVYLKHFIPFASPKYSWKAHQDKSKTSRNITISLANAMFTQDVDLSSEDAKTRTQKLGPLTLKLMQDVSSTCFDAAIKNAKAEFLFQVKDKCISIDHITADKQIINGFTVQKTKAKPFVKVIITDDKGQEFNFYPALSNFPITKDIRIDENSKARLVQLGILRKGPHVIFFPGNMMVYGKEASWTQTKFEVNKDVNLPWMGFKLTVTRLIENKYQHVDWFENPPKGNESKRHFAAEVILKNRYKQADTQTIWIADTGLKKVQTKSGIHLDFMIGNKLQHLPFMLELDRFKMDTNPGTTDPASYESFVKVKGIMGEEEAHIYMNNPLQKGKFTFYQASYFQLQDGKGYGSVLSVNHDPGRATKYAGSILLVLGSIIHFTLRSLNGRKK